LIRYILTIPGRKKDREINKKKKVEQKEKETVNIFLAEFLLKLLLYIYKTAVRVQTY